MLLTLRPEASLDDAWWSCIPGTPRGSETSGTWNTNEAVLRYNRAPGKGSTVVYDWFTRYALALPATAVISGAYLTMFRVIGVAQSVYNVRYVDADDGTLSAHPTAFAGTPISATIPNATGAWTSPDLAALITSYLARPGYVPGYHAILAAIWQSNLGMGIGQFTSWDASPNTNRASLAITFTLPAGVWFIRPGVSYVGPSRGYDYAVGGNRRRIQETRESAGGNLLVSDQGAEVCDWALRWNRIGKTDCDLLENFWRSLLAANAAQSFTWLDHHGVERTVQWAGGFEPREVGYQIYELSVGLRELIVNP